MGDLAPASARKGNLVILTLCMFKLCYKDFSIIPDLWEYPQRRGFDHSVMSHEPRVTSTGPRQGLSYLQGWPLCGATSLSQRSFELRPHRQEQHPKVYPGPQKNLLPKYFEGWRLSSSNLIYKRRFTLLSDLAKKSDEASSMTG